MSTYGLEYTLGSENFLLEKVKITNEGDVRRYSNAMDDGREEMIKNKFVEMLGVDLSLVELDWLEKSYVMII